MSGQVGVFPKELLSFMSDDEIFKMANIFAAEFCERKGWNQMRLEIQLKPKPGDGIVNMAECIPWVILGDKE